MTASLQIKGNYYHVYLRYKDDAGKWKQKSIATHLTVSGNNKRKAERMRIEILREYESKLQMGSDMYVSDYFTRWLENIKPEVQPNTYRGYSGNMNKHIIPYFKEKKICLRDLKAAHLEAYYKAKLESGLSAQTIKHHCQNISNALKYAVRDGLIAANPAQFARSPKTEKFKGKFLNAEQVTELLALTKQSTIYIPVMLGAYFGLRRSEILGLTWENVDFEKRRITISKTVLQNTGGEYVRESTKNNSSYRTLPMTEPICNMLLQHRQNQAERRKIMRSHYNDSDYVCTFDDGTPIKPNYLTKTFHEIIQESSLPQIRLHDLRHSVASNLLAEGFSIVEIQEWLGHSSPSTTLNFYSHIDSSKSKTAISQSLSEMMLENSSNHA